MTTVTPDATVTLPAGTVSGTTLKSGVRQYLGVPYAEPPIDSREAAFEAPRPLTLLRPEMEAGAREADAPYAVQPLAQCAAAYCCCAPGAACCISCCWCCCRARGEGTDGKGMGLDVLRMNIWSPATDAKAAPAPVMVFIHGGGDAGSGKMGDPNARTGEHLAAAQGVVVCVLDFRIGIFGTLDWGSGSDVPPNLELRDIVCALQWLQANVGSFGGDAASVTIVGESIGGRRVCELLWCPAAKGLFHRAVATSPSAPEAANLSEAHRAARRRLVNRYLGLADDATPTKAELARYPRQQLLHAQSAAKGGSPLLPRTRLWGASAEDKRLFGAAAQVPISTREIASAGLGFLGWRTVDGLRTAMFDASVLDGDYMPSAVGDSAPAVAVPLLLLHVKDEYSAFKLMAGLQPSAVTSRETALERLVELLPVRGVLDAATRSKLAGGFFDAYAANVLPEGARPRDVYVAAMQDLWQYHACVAVGEAHAAALPRQTYLAKLVYDCKGATPHGADVSFFFGAMPGLPIHDKGRDFDGITAVVQQAYAAFARSGDPSTAAAPFTPFDATAPKMTLLDSAVSGVGSRVVETERVRDEAYRTLVAAIRAAET